MNNEEIWKDIIGYEGLYQVSSLGRVRSLDRYDERNCFRKGKVLSPGIKPDGYLVVVLSCNGKHKTIKVHRLVAQAFIPNPDGLPQVNHKNEDKSNNRVENLEWCDAKYNINFGTARIRSINTKIKNGYVNEENVGLSKKEYWKKYNQGRKEYLKKYYQNYYQDHKDKISDSNRSYYQENKDKICDRVKEYSQKNKEKIREYHHQYYLKKEGRDTK